MSAHEIRAFTPASPAKPAALGWKGGRSRRLREMLKLPPRGKPLLDAINKGFSVNILREVAGNLAVDVYWVGKYIDIKSATLDRRLRDGVLTTAESDRLYRFTEVYDTALDLFEGDRALANQWLNTPAIGLGGEIPLAVIRTSTGANDVLLLLQKLDRGVLI